MLAFFVIVLVLQAAEGRIHRQTDRRARLVGDADDAAGRAEAGVAGDLGLLVAALAEVVGAGVDDDGALGGVSGGVGVGVGVCGDGEGSQVE